MTVPLIPESAPFTTAQRAWLNGFFAGLLNLDPATLQQTPVEVSVSTTAPVNPIDSDDFPWHDPALPLNDRLALAKDHPLNDQLMSAMAQLDCGSCGYMCRTYSNAIADGSEKDLGKCVPGAKETARALKQIVKLSVSADNGNGNGKAHTSVTVTDRITPDAPPPAFNYSRSNPFLSPLLDAKPLNQPGSAKDTRFISLGLGSGQLTYKVGDSVGVFARNCYQQVDALIRVLDCSGAEPVNLANRTTTLREALINDCDIDRPSDTLYEVLAGSAADSDHARLLRTLADGADEAEGLAPQARVIDVMARFTSARPTPTSFANALGRLQPRLYSISSSPKRHPDQVHLTVGVVRYELSGQQRKGVASSFMADRLLPYEPVRIFIQPSHNFSLTDDPHRPIIMVGPGTGIAPFRAFLQQREATAAGGSNWLFFGDQHEAADFLYRDELQRWLSTGLLTRLDTAFSRDQNEKIYVQHRMIEHGNELFSWLADGACFYVCGDANRMAKDVDLALRSIIAEHGRMSAEQADAWLKQLADAGRYQRDVY